jgi:uncharacterized protein YicC (UPF0701 family)
MLRADLALARQYHDALVEIGRTLDLPDPVTLALVAGQPGVLEVGERARDPDTLWRALAPGVDAALTALVETRAREGAALRADLQARLGTLEEAVRALGVLTRDAPEVLRRKLTERLERALRPGLGDASALGRGDPREPAATEMPPWIDPQRLAQEVAILADKADVSEELTRLQLHLVELRRLVDAGEASGRRLDFLTQELHREVNTIGSKSQSAEIAARIVDAKAEVERLREQIQNVE